MASLTRSQSRPALMSLFQTDEQEAPAAPPTPPPPQQQSPRPEQHAGLQPPATQFEQEQQQQQSAARVASLGSHTSLGLLDRLALQQRTALQGGLQPSRGSKVWSLSSSSSRVWGGSDDGGLLGGAPPQSPLRDYGPPVAAQLTRRCAKARKLLGRLQQPVLSLADGGPRPPLPNAALRFCRGLAFVRQRKAGVLGALNWGYALLIARLADGSWSAPCFLTLRYASLGLTLGAQRIRSVYVLQASSAEQIAAFACDSAALRLDVALPSEVDPFELEGTTPVRAIRHHDLTLPPNATKPHSATVSDGTFLDLSVRAGFTFVDSRLHSCLYGEGFTPQDILGGRVQAPPELAPLYADIEGRAAEAKAARRTISKYEMARMLFMQRTSMGSRTSQRGPLKRQSSLSVEAPGTVERQDGGPVRTSTSTTDSLLAGSSPDGGVSPRSPAKLFGDVDIEFEEMHSYDQQEAGEAAAAAQAAAAAAAGPSRQASLKLFGSDEIGFVEEHSYEQQEMEGAAAEAAAAPRSCAC
ncbi:SH3 domain-containing [Micractinium conductrix]|uniref:SH3 domain-containing n=1 Tax=Micractinium conductrix TaxID=554055 RepID=A0A2P6VCA2_9CHLO|nr:SH3 domain-containing [Micractinium conductrix]|eukprot:PSC71713.1 SH3 domain-containing [Micractinium conductrix]